MGAGPEHGELPRAGADAHRSDVIGRVGAVTAGAVAGGDSWRRRRTGSGAEARAGPRLRGAWAGAAAGVASGCPARVRSAIGEGRVSTPPPARPSTVAADVFHRW